MLLDLIKTYPSERLLWISSDKDPLCVSDCLKQLSQQTELFKQCRQKNVAVCLSSPLDLMISLILLDECAQQLFLLPCEDSEIQEKLLKDSGSEILITDSKKEFSLDIKTILFQWSDTAEKAPLPDSENLDTTWLLATSGTTGTPKLIEHTIGDLTKTHHRDIDKGQSYTWGLVYDVTRFAGLQVFLQSLLSLSPLILTDSSSTLAQQVDAFVQNNCNALSATPTLWRKILMTKESENLDLKQITLGGEIVDQAILDALATRFPTARMAHIFAATETGVGFSVNDKKCGFPADYLKTPPLGIRMKVDEDGYLWIKSTKESDYINTGDLVKQEGDRCLFLGRANGSINVGGNKVMPEEVESVMMELKGVRLAAVKPKKNPLVGSLVVADIVLEDPCVDQKQFIEQLKKHCQSNLESFKVPAFIKIVEDLPTNPTGKIQR